MDAGRILQELDRTPGELNHALRTLANAKAAAEAYKAEKVAMAQENLEWLTAEVSLEAMAEGAIDGKNQATRDIQLKAHLAKSDAIFRARASLSDAEAELRGLEAKSAGLEAECKSLSYRLRAAMAAAELEAALLNAGKRENDE